MYISASQKRIGTAVLLGAAVIAVSVYVRSTSERQYAARTTNNSTDGIVVTEAPKRVAIAVTDSNGDGVPDWQESLVATETLALDATPVSNYTAPDTLTGQFSQQFFERIVRSKMNNQFGTAPDEIVASAAESLGNEAMDTMYTMSDLTVLPSYTTANLIAYGEHIAYIIAGQDADTGVNELYTLKEAVVSGDPTTLVGLDAKIEIYQNLLDQTLQASVPSVAAQQHLDLINSYQAVLNDIIAMRQSFDDPVRALLRIKRYQDDVTGLSNAIANLYTVLLTNNASWSPESIVYTVVSIR